MRILHVNFGATPTMWGGAIVHAEALAELQARAGNNVAILATGFWHKSINGPQLRTTERNGCIFLLAYNTSMARDQQLDNSLSFPELDKIFHEQISQFHPDIIHFHTIQMTGVTLLRQCHAIAPVIFSAHNYWPMCFRQNRLRPDGATCPGNNPSETMDCFQFCLGKSNAPPNAMHILAERTRVLGESMKRNIDLFHAVSQSVAERYIAFGIAKDKIKVLPPFSSALLQIHQRHAAHRVRPAGLCFGYFGGNVKSKGIHTLLQAWQKLPQGILAQAELHLWGGGCSAEEAGIEHKNVPALDRKSVV